MINSQILPSDFHILIVDDNPKNIQVLGSILREVGYNVEFTLDGQSAIELIQKESFDIILLDIMMPEISGYEVCKAIKQIDKKKDIPIIFISAKTDLDSLIKGFEVGAVDYITKPFNVKELICRVQIHIELQWRRKQLAKANSEKDKFYSIVAHDIKNPFTSILTTFDLLDLVYENIDKNQIKDKLKSVKKDIEMIVTTSTNLLHWASYQSSFQKLNPVHLPVSDAIKEAIALENPIISQKNIQFVVDIPNDLVTIFDKEQFGIVVRNLISNALKFSYSEGKIDIKAKMANKKVELTIEDYGIGMPVDMLNKLFVLSEKTTRLGTKNEKGTGLGLLLIKKYIKGNGGEIAVASIEDKGTRFTLSLPVA